jgi:hypothetical protein
MNEILIITNHADDAHLIDFAYQFACQNGKNLAVAQMYKANVALQLSPELVSIHGNCQHSYRTSQVSQFANRPNRFNDKGHLPRLRTIDASHFTGREMAAYVRREGFAVVISRLEHSRVNMQSLLNKLSCPLMLLPEGFPAREIHRTVYLTDLRYCQQSILNQLTKFKGTSLLLAHTCQSGLPDLVSEYSSQLFADTVGRYSASQELFFSHIKEKNMQKVIDTLVNTMHADMLVCLNRGFHFQQFFGDHLPKRLPDYIYVPLLVFPS